MNATNDNAVHHDANQLIAYLALPSAIAFKGRVWCETEAMLLRFGLSSTTPAEASQRMAKQIAGIRLALGAGR